MNWTYEQERAILYQQERELLVSAAAGSGKTSVMTERILLRCLQEDISPEKLIVLTFTDKAASNMKRKLEEKVRDRLAKESNPETKVKLKRIQTQLPLTQISTIHSFCLRLLREYKHLLVDQNDELLYPEDFVIIDAYESEMLLNDALDEVLTEIYEHFLGEEELSTKDEAWFNDFLAMQNISGAQKSDQSFREEVLQRYHFLRSLPNYREWCREAFNELVYQEENFVDSPACHYYLGQLEQCVQKAEKSFLNLENHPYYEEIYKVEKKKSKEKLSFQENYPGVKKFIAGYRKLRSQGQSSQALSTSERATIWDFAVMSGRNFGDWDNLRSSKSDSEKMEFRELLYTGVGPLMQTLQDAHSSGVVGEQFGLKQITFPFYLTLDEIEAGSKAMFSEFERFLELIFLLDERYKKLKRAKNAIDYSDYEHLALRIVELPGVAEVIKGNFLEVLIDEYQDSSPLQEALIQALGTERITMLGDIKQSIYRFRHANPEIFNQKLNNFADCTYEELAENPSSELFEKPSTGSPENSNPNASKATKSSDNTVGEVILLNKNFRSRGELLALINDFFARFLRMETGQIDYDETQALVAGRESSTFPERSLNGPKLSITYTFQPKEKLEVENALDVIPEVPTNNLATSIDDFSDAQISLLDAVTDLFARGFKPEEIAILTRTNQLAEDARDGLEQAEIPVYLNLEKEFLSSAELRLLTTLVEFLANPCQDIPLAAVLRSGLSGDVFLEEDLFKIAQLEVTAENEESAEAALKSAARQTLNTKFFYSRFLYYSEIGPDESLRARCERFIKLVDEWREQATYLAPADLLRRILESSTWLDELADKPFANQRLTDVEDFLNFAEAYGQNNPQDFSGFARYLEQIQANKVKFKPDEGGEDRSGYISVLTMHGSKGLEFPAVIYYEASKSRREDSVKATRLFSADDGLAANYPLDEGEKISPRKLYFHEQEVFRERAEDYRLLYVAMTRAEEVLYITGSGSENSLETLTEIAVKARSMHSDHGFSRGFLNQLDSDFKLMFAWQALSLPDLTTLFEVKDSAESLVLQTEEVQLQFAQRHNLWREILLRRAKLEIDHAVEPLEQSHLALSGISGEGVSDFAFPATEREKNRVKKLLNLHGLDDKRMRIPGKVTVSELQTWSNDVEERQGDGALSAGLYEMALELRSSSLSDTTLSFLPGSDTTEISSVAPTGMSAAEYGTFLHRLFELLPVTSFYELQGERAKLKSESDAIFYNFINAREEEKLIDAQASIRAKGAYPYIEAFLKSELGHRLAKVEMSGGFVGRELPFTLAVPALGLDEGCAGDEITLVQGMMDLFFDEGEETIILDYKSDRLYGSEHNKLMELKKRYNTQLEYYTLAVERLRDVKVKESYIWLIREGRAVKMW